MRNRIIGESQLADRMRVAVERKQAAGVERLPRKHVVNVLAVPVAVELDGLEAADRRDTTWGYEYIAVLAQHLLG